MKYATVAVCSMLLMSCNAEMDSRTKTIDTPDGQITVTVKTVDPTPQRVSLASPAELERFRLSAAQAPSFVSTYMPDANGSSLKDLDEAFRRWQLQNPQTFSQDQVVEMLGATLGEKLVADLDMEWVVVSDQSGTDYAVRSKKSEVMSFPFSSVQKRIDRNEYEFMVGVYHSVRSALESGEYRPRSNANDG